MVGHSEKLLLNKNYANKVDVSKLLFNSEVVNKEYTFKAYKPNFLENTIDQRVLLPLCKEAIEGKLVKKIDIEISNTEIHGCCNRDIPRQSDIRIEGYGDIDIDIQ